MARRRPFFTRYVLDRSPRPGTAEQLLGLDRSLVPDEPTDDETDPLINLLLLDSADELDDGTTFLELEGMTDVGLQIED